MTTLTPYLGFSGECEAALRLYTETFGGRVKTLMRYGDVMPDVPEERRRHIVHAEFEADGLAFMASDGPGGQAGGRVTLALAFADTAEQERVWARLAEGGAVVRPLHDTFYGGRLGVLTDRFGIDWMLNWSPPAP